MKIFLFLCYIALCQATENVHEKIYVRLLETIPCILRLNGSQSFGCTSKRGGSVGVVHRAYDNASLNWILDTPKNDAYIVVLNIEMFTMNNLKKLNDSDWVSGVLLVQNVPRSEINKFSPESRCPNRYSGLADAAHDYSSGVCPAEDPWNRIGTEIAMQFWNMPMFFTDDNSTIKAVEDCYKSYNEPLSNQADRALCALELDSYMFASGDSNKCIRRSVSRYDINPSRLCDILADENIYTPAIPFDKFNKTKNESYIFVTARLDATSLFFGRASGALSTVTSLVGLLLTSNLLARLLADNKSIAKRNVVFVLLNGEAYDYLGSQKLVFDMEHDEFPYKEAPLRLDDVGLFIELSQLRQSETLSYHTYKNMSKATVPLINKFEEKYEIASKAFKFDTSLEEWPSRGERFPPSSYQSFLTRKAVPGFVVSSYQEYFQTQFYHSIFDDAESIRYKFSNGTNSLSRWMASFATVLAHTLYSLMMETEATTKLEISDELADQVLNCFLESPRCEFFSRFGGSSLNPNLDYFISIGRAPSQMTALSKSTLKYLTGRNVSADNQNECADKANNFPWYSYLWVPSESRCLESFVNSSVAVSPAFIIPEYELHEGIYSSWTESTWSKTSVRMFRKPSAKYEWLVSMIGSSILIASFFIVFWVRRNSRDLFNFPQLIATSSI